MKIVDLVFDVEALAWREIPAGEPMQICVIPLGATILFVGPKDGKLMVKYSLPGDVPTTLSIGEKNEEQT